MRHPTICTASLVTARDIIRCIEWFCYLRQWYGHVVSSSEDSLVGLNEVIQERWVRQSHQMVSSSVPSDAPQVLWSSWRVMATTRRWKVSWSDMALRGRELKVEKRLDCRHGRGQHTKGEDQGHWGRPQDWATTDGGKRRAALGSQRKDQGHCC